MLVHLDRLEEAKEEFEYVVRKIDHYRAANVSVWWTEDPLEASAVYLEACQELGRSNPEVVIGHLENSTKPWDSFVLGRAYSLKGDIESAIESYATGAWSKTEPTDPISGECEEALLRLALADDSQLAHVRNVFEHLMKLEEGVLDLKHPRRVFTMRGLAQILIKQSEDLDLARDLLGEALALLQEQNLAPATAAKEITDLLHEIDEHSTPIRDEAEASKTKRRNTDVVGDDFRLSSVPATRDIESLASK
jgi:tetratricopeptide (TPR) repeat protein